MMKFILYNGWSKPRQWSGWDDFMLQHVFGIMTTEKKYRSGCIMFIPGTYNEMMQDYG